MTYNQWYEKYIKGIQEPDGNGIIKPENLAFDLQLFGVKYESYSDKALRSSIRRHRKEIEHHEDKIRNPDNYISADNPQKNNPKYREGLKRHWQKEIDNFTAQIKRAQEELERRCLL